jgi:hypothetical protein
MLPQLGLKFDTKRKPLTAVQIKCCTSSYTQCFGPIWIFIRYWLMHTALEIEEEASEVLHLERNFIWC